MSTPSLPTGVSARIGNPVLLLRTPIPMRRRRDLTRAPGEGARDAAVVRLVRVPADALIAPDAIPLQVTGLARHYGRLVGLAHFDLELRPGQCVALIGANGSGKSTAVRTISGLLEPT